ncbi:hypothetical protein NEOLEDRAFT_623154 [Neolentinus lepideus HHB14362 ss-1]|uniref:Secreted protein n=1 Tax=Neolentinus lepideus HHB14362 ss-1 TaxID=1314782 RepID=A0A165QTK2_9AGAM|nr:hypothetical protein NEOLEDRAFT_623154 [Neolentinus lepideus HHB14362 ss-1]
MGLLLWDFVALSVSACCCICSPPLIHTRSPPPVSAQTRMSLRWRYVPDIPYHRHRLKQPASSRLAGPISRIALHPWLAGRPKFLGTCFPRRYDIAVLAIVSAASTFHRHILWTDTRPIYIQNHTNHTYTSNHLNLVSYLIGDADPQKACTVRLEPVSSRLHFEGIMSGIIRRMCILQVFDTDPIRA